MRIALLVLIALGTGAVAPAVAAAQGLEQRTDSLEREIRLLRARIDSLVRVLERLTREDRDTTPARDELAALRAAARAAAARPDTAQAPEPQFVNRADNLNRLNPEISVTGDVRFTATRPGPQQDNVDLREFEFSFQSALDPFARTKIFLAFEEGEIDLEEAYAYWTGLPGGFRIDAGRLRQQVGELNRWHLHALPESEYPLVLREYFGEEGLIGNGLRVYWLAPFSGVGTGTHELWGEVTVADNDVLFDGGNRLAVLGHVKNFWQVSRSVFVQLGGTAMYGRNPDADLRTRVLGGDVRLSWRPPADALYRSFTLRGEGYAVRRLDAGVGDTRYGGYVSAEYQLSRRLFLGGRLDYVEPLGTADPATWAVVPRLTWWQSEWVYLKAEWQRASTPLAGGGRDTSDRFVLQAVWAIGPHKHETY